MPFSRICAAAAGLTLAIAIVGIGITVANRSLTRDVAARQQQINQAMTLGQINLRLATALASVAARDNDDRIRELMEAHGIAARAGASPSPKAPAPAGKTP